MIFENINNWREWSKADKLKLYKHCKETYAAGNSPLEDFEFDELQDMLGYENKDNTPTKHNPKYTIHHPVKMGSLSKVQIKRSADGTIDWDGFSNKVKKYVLRNISDAPLIITPKFDGCSFEVVVEDAEIKSISGRGDGEYGPDYRKQLINIVYDAIKNILSLGNFILRGEVLINKETFIKKYSIIADPENGYVNPRSWVAGLLGRDYDNTDGFYLDMLSDISIVIYDVKFPDVKNDGSWVDADWTIFSELYNSDYVYINDKYLPSEFFMDLVELDKSFSLEDIYNKFNDYRIKNCPYALDGIVIKPMCGYRKYVANDYRPKDCVAVKFMPQLQETEVIDISWKLGEKSKNYVPTIVTNPVEMDGKQITHAAASNYGKLIYDKISVGTKVILSLAGDIIPFIYKITDTSAFDENKLCIPTQYETYIEEGGVRADGKPTLNLKAILSEDDLKRLNFIVSAKVLNIPNFGPALAEKVWDYVSTPDVKDETDDFFGITSENTTQKMIPNNILFVSPTEVSMAIGGKNGDKIMKDYKKIINNITLKDIIYSCNFKFCGEKVAEQCANYLCGMEYDFSHLAKEGYEWCLNENNCEETGPTDNLNQVLNLCSVFGKTPKDFKVVKSDEQIAFENEQIPVILTGEPNDYASKGEFLKLHPEYRLTGKWTEVKIVFTNSLESNTGKMKKAREKGIELRLY